MLYNICMDFDEKKRRQLIRVIIAEVGMVLSVIAIVVVAVLAAMGFMISSNGAIEQSGLMQLHTMPTGATVQIDGNTLFSRTNLSRTLTAGKHSLELTREGYDSWKKEINIHAGVLMRLYYPRLFLQNREVEMAKILTEEGLEFYAPSQNRNYILYAQKLAAEWKLLDMRGDEIKVVPLDLSGILPGMVELPSKQSGVTGKNIETHTYEFAGKIEKVVWSANEEKVLVKVTYEGVSEWVLVNLWNMAESLNITRTFGLGEVHVEMIDAAASQLYILDKHQLKRINTNDRVMSRVLLENVWSFASYGSSVIYLSDNDKSEQLVGVYRDDEKGGTVIAKVPTGKNVQIAISNYYDEDYLVYTVDDEVTVMYGKIPSYSEEGASLAELKELVAQKKLASVPEEVSVSPDGEYVVAQKAEQLMVLDLDMGDLYEYAAPSAELRWLDAGMIYALREGEIIVWDFDGTNQRNLSESQKETDEEAKAQLLNAPVMITANNRWLYYLVKNEKGATVLARELIRE